MYIPFMYIFLVILIIFLLTWLFSKKTIAFWIYFNSLMLAVYLPLLDVKMPQNVVLLFMPFIDVYRVKLLSLTSDYQTFKQEEDDSDGSVIIYNNDPTGSLQSLGYSAFIFNNAPLLLAFLGFILIAWLFTFIKDNLRRLPGQNHEIPICNFLVRFSYQAFLQIALCVFLSLKASKLLIEGDFAGQWLLSFFLLVAMIGFIVFLCYKIVYGGPYIPGYYGKVTFSSLLCWQARP